MRFPSTTLDRTWQLAVMALATLIVFAACGSENPTGNPIAPPSTDPPEASALTRETTRPPATTETEQAQPATGEPTQTTQAPQQPPTARPAGADRTYSTPASTPAPPRTGATAAATAQASPTKPAPPAGATAAPTAAAPASTTAPTPTPAPEATPTPEPPPSLVAISVQGKVVWTPTICVLNSEDSAICRFNEKYNDPDSPLATEEFRGNFAKIEAGTYSNHAVCGTTRDAEAICVDRVEKPGLERIRNLKPRTRSSYTTFLDASLHYPNFCIVDPDGKLECEASYGLYEPVEDAGAKFTEVFTEAYHGCALTEEQRVHCWGKDSWQHRVPSPEGTFKSITTSPATNCGIRTDGTPHCWGTNEFLYNPQAPEGPYTTIAVADHVVCAITPEGRMDCWGPPIMGAVENPMLEFPEGTYKDVALEEGYGCAITTDDRILCWGEVSGELDLTPR